MIIRRPQPKALGINEPLRHEHHSRPMTRRQLLAQGFITGGATIVAPSLLGLFANPRMAHALSTDIEALKAPAFCNIQEGAGKVPFICFDLAGGANIAGSNVLIGQGGRQDNFLSTAGYVKHGLAGGMSPTASVTGSFIDNRLGLLFHSDSAFLRGMMTKISPSTAANINGCVIPARSENDTGNNPHNPMYGIARAGARGSLLGNIGSQNSDSGGNSMAPAMMMDPALRPTKIDRSSDTTGLVDVGDLGTMFTGPTGLGDTVSVMESIERVSDSKLDRVSTLLGGSGDADQKKLVQCSYVKTADTTEKFSSTDVVNPQSVNDVLVGPSTPAAIWELNNFRSSGEYDKTASVAKLVINGYAGAGTISMGGFDYHTGERATGELRDFRAGECMGACLEYAARKGRPLMLYCFSDGSLNSNGRIDNSVNGRGKGEWTGDNQAVAASFFLVYSPNGRPNLARPPSAGSLTGWQIGSMNAGGDTLTASSPAANAVNLLVETIILNYMALHGEEGQFQTLFPNSGLSTGQLSSLIAFSSLSNVAPPPPPPPPPPVVITSCSSAGASISANHGHTLTVPPADLDSVTPRTYSIMGASLHNHTVTLSVQNLQALRLGPVTVASTADMTDQHTHMVTVTCS